MIYAKGLGKRGEKGCQVLKIDGRWLIVSFSPCLIAVVGALRRKTEKEDLGDSSLGSPWLDSMVKCSLELALDINIIFVEHLAW